MLGLFGWCSNFNLKWITSMEFFCYLPAFYIVQWESYDLVQLERRPFCFAVLLIMPIKKSLLIVWKSHTFLVFLVESEKNPYPPLPPPKPCHQVLFLVLRICIFWIERSLSYLLTQILISWYNNYWLCCRDIPVLLIWQLNAKWLVY